MSVVELVNAGIFASHHACQCQRAAGIGDDKIACAQRVVATVERRERLRSHSHDERRCRGNLRRVEGMQRLAQFHHT